MQFSFAKNLATVGKSSPSTGHKNVACLISLHRHEDKIIVVMPYFEHIDLKAYFNDLAFSELRYYFSSLFSALQFCHSKDIIHRDVKPANFLYHPTKRFGVLVDFGLAQVRSISFILSPLFPPFFCSTYYFKSS
ncbi:hypothetical protein HMI54_006774 [Coelomomyces lativittatus]|nr:hypothetical protein HMI54_006774 [Coelomomyces lativittatus]